MGFAEIVEWGGRYVRAATHGAGVGVGSNGVTGGGKIGPGRKKRRGCRKRNARGAKSEHQRECKTAASRLPRDHDALRWIARAKNCAVGGDGIFDGSGKTIFGREAIGRSQHAEPLESQASGDGTIRLRRAAEVAATVKIKEHA